MGFPKEHRAKIDSIDTLEQLNGVVKRRTDVVGILPNEAASRRLVGALLCDAGHNARKILRPLALPATARAA